MTTSTSKIGAIVKLDDGRTFELFEGYIVRDLVYTANGVSNTVSGTVRVLEGVTKQNASTSNSCPPEPYMSNYITINSMIIDSSAEFDAELNRVAIGTIDNIGSVETGANDIVVGVGVGFKSLSEVMTAAPAGSSIKLEAGEYTEAITINKSVKLFGAPGAKMAGKINVFGNGSEKLEVELVGIDFGADALIETKGVDTFVMKGCTFGGHNITARTQPIMLAGDHPVKVIIEDNVFTDENEFSYNLINANAVALKDGSSISGNKFMGINCTNNHISLQKVEDGAHISINDNYCYDSKNMVRIGFKGAPKNVIVDVNNNTYEVSNTSDDYKGLLLVQPSNFDTTDMSGITININNTTKPDGQLVYMYAGAKDMQFTDTNKPTIIVNGAPYEAPIRA